MKKITLIIFVALLAVSCNREMEKAMKSADKDLILKVANEKFANKKWKDALALYERLGNLVAGTDDAPNVIFNTAFANYYDANYKLAGHQFKNFSVTFPQEQRAEEAAYMSALCYYEGSMDYNLDQSSTELAINELQNFLNAYPNSTRAKNIDALVDELSYKLEFKAYENARQYYKMQNYKAAIVSFENLLDDFPATKLKPKVYEFLMESRYELALGSRFDLKEDRLINAIAFSKQVESTYPDTKQAKAAADMREKLIKEQKDFVKTKVEYEASMAELTAKQKLEFDKIAKADEKRLERKRERNARKIAKDSVVAGENN